VKHLKLVLVSILATAACAAEAPPDVDGSSNNGGGGDGNGSGNGSGDGNGSGNGSGGGGGGGGGGNTSSATGFLAAMAQKFCGQAFTCQADFPTDAGVTFADIFGASESACVSDSAQYDMPAAVEAAITAGKITFNAADASACISGLTFGTCTEFWTQGPNVPQACSTALVGTVADGGACTTSYECKNLNAYCEAAKCTPDEAGARQLPSRENDWHMQTPEILKSAM
jgi:hypothetical protein